MNRHPSVASVLLVGTLFPCAVLASSPPEVGARPQIVASTEVTRFAIVVGNNRADVAETPNLRYADDDAVATHRLLVQAGVDSLLLVRLDDDSRAVHPALTPSGAPRGRDLDKALADLYAKIRAHDKDLGTPTELLIFYSGHGDVEDGEGYLSLEDRRLTRSMLYEILTRSPAHRNHVFIDACKSYFLVFDRGPGGRRTPYDRRFVSDTVPARLENTGFVLSTSSDRDSHEWERYEAGILSHELRSALRGAADVDGDGRLTYAEIGAFISTANESIPNPRFRPDVMIRPPRRDLQQEVLRWRPNAGALRLGRTPLGHVYVESPSGARLLDAHPARGQHLTLHLPSDRPLFIRTNDEKAEYALTMLQQTEVASLGVTRPEIAQRGALHLAFKSLFELPFGAGQVDLFARRHSAAGAREDASEPASVRRRRILNGAAGSVAVGAAVAGATLSVLAARAYRSGMDSSQTERARLNHTTQQFNFASFICYGVAASAGITWGFTKWWPGTTLTAAPVEGQGQGQGRADDRPIARGIIIGLHRPL